MSSRTVRLLALGVVVLFAVVFLMNRDGGEEHDDAGLLLPELEAALDGVTAVTVASADGTALISNDDGRWVVPDKNGYPADFGTLRSLLLALAQARKVEQKTANPALYDRLGVADPTTEGEGDGVLVTGSGGDGTESFAVILGDAAQGEYRYARLPDEEPSWLIDRNPQVPESAGEWLVREIVDIPPSSVRWAETRHADGEVIRIGKESADETNFRVEDVPQGRELSYPSVADGIGGVLSNLRLDDVRPTVDAEPSATLALATFDGLEIAVDVWREQSAGEGEDEDATTWIALAASASERSEDDVDAASAEPEPAASGGGEAGSGPDATGEVRSDGASDESAAEAGDGEAGLAAGDGEADNADAAPNEESGEPDPQEQAAGINERVRGWQYQVPDYKARQLTRRWDDLLKEAEE